MLSGLVHLAGAIIAAMRAIELRDEEDAFSLQGICRCRGISTPAPAVSLLGAVPNDTML